MVMVISIVLRLDNWWSVLRTAMTAWSTTPASSRASSDALSLTKALKTLLDPTKITDLL